MSSFKKGEIVVRGRSLYRVENGTSLGKIGLRPVSEDDGAGEPIQADAKELRLATVTEKEMGVVGKAPKIHGAGKLVIFFDLDDCMANYSKHYIDHPKEYLSEWWWSTIPPYPWCKKLWKLAQERGLACVLSSPGDEPALEARAGKTKWCNTVLKLKGKVQKDPKGGWDGSRIVLLRHKYLILSNIPKADRKNYVLVDDRRLNTKTWERMGGTAILFRNAAQTEKAIKALGKPLSEGFALRNFGNTLTEMDAMTDEELEEAAVPTEWLHGDPRKRTSFVGQKMDRDRTRADANANGPGIYWTTDTTEARGYAGPSGFVHKAAIKVNSARLLKPSTKPTRAKLKKLMLAAPETGLETGLSNWGYDPGYSSKDDALDAALDAYEDERELLDAAVAIQHDFYADAPDEWAKAMVKLGYDAYLVKDRPHLVVYNPKIIRNLIATPYKDMNESKEKKPWRVSFFRYGNESMKGMAFYATKARADKAAEGLKKIKHITNVEVEKIEESLDEAKDYAGSTKLNPDGSPKSTKNTGWTIVKKAPIKRGSLAKNTAPIMGLKDMSANYGIWKNRQEAMEAAVDMWFPEVVTKPWPEKKRHWPYCTKQLGLVAVKAKGGKAIIPEDQVVEADPEESKIPPQFRSKLDNPAAKRKRKESTMDEAKKITAADVKRIDRVDMEKVWKKYPTIGHKEDLSLGRGQGKRSGGMVKGGMATVGLSAFIRDYGKQFKVTGDDLDELKSIAGDPKGMMLPAYARARYAGYPHGQAATYAFMKDDPTSTAQDIADAMMLNEDGSSNVLRFKSKFAVSESVARGLSRKGKFVPVDEAYEARDAFVERLVPNKSVLIGQVWYTITKRSLTNDTVELDNTRFAATNGIKGGKKKSMSFSGLVKAIKGGKIGADINGKHYGPRQDEKARNARRKKAGLSAMPGHAKENLDRIDALTEAAARSTDFHKLAAEIDSVIVGKKLAGKNTRPKTLMAWLEDGGPLYLADGGLSRVYLTWTSGDYPTPTIGSESSADAKKAWNSPKGKKLQAKLKKLIKQSYDRVSEAHEAVDFWPLDEKEDKGTPDKTTLRLIASMFANKSWPEKAEKGKAYVVLWADGRGIAAFQTKREVQNMANKNGSWSEFVWIKYQEPEYKGKKLRVSWKPASDMGESLLEAINEASPDDGGDDGGDDTAPAGGDGAPAPGAGADAGNAGGAGGAEPEEDPEKEKRKEDGYHKGDIQDYYDMLQVQGVPQAKAITKTKRQFKLKDLRISPAGRILTKDDVAEKPPAMNPMMGAPMGGGEEGAA